MALENSGSKSRVGRRGPVVLRAGERGELKLSLPLRRAADEECNPKQGASCHPVIMRAEKT